MFLQMQRVAVGQALHLNGLHGGGGGFLFAVAAERAGRKPVQVEDVRSEVEKKMESQDQ